MLDARRLHWIGKSFAELRTVETTLETATLPMEVRYSHAAARFFFAVRWAIENVFIMIKLKVSLAPLCNENEGGFYGEFLKKKTNHIEFPPGHQLPRSLDDAE